MVGHHWFTGIVTTFTPKNPWFDVLGIGGCVTIQSSLKNYTSADPRAEFLNSLMGQKLNCMVLGHFAAKNKNKIYNFM
jgi:hypothetical protein